MAPKKIIINNYNTAHKIINNNLDKNKDSSKTKINNNIDFDVNFGNEIINSSKNNLKNRFKKSKTNDNSDTDSEDDTLIDSDNEIINNSKNKLKKHSKNSDTDFDDEILINSKKNHNKLVKDAYSYENPSHSKYIFKLIKQGSVFPISDFYNQHVLYSVIIDINNTKHNYIIIKFGYSNDLKKRLKSLSNEYKAEIYFIKAKTISSESDEKNFHKILKTNYSSLVEKLHIKNTNKTELYKFHSVLLEEFDKFMNEKIESPIKKKKKINNKNMIYNNKNMFVIIDNDNKIWFKATDVANILEYKRSTNAIKYHIDEEDKCVFRDLQPSIDNSLLTKKQKSRPGTIYINESGFYSIALSSKQPDAKSFKKWVTCEVLPSLQKHGKYNIEKKHQFEINKLKATNIALQNKIKKLKQ